MSIGQKFLMLIGLAIIGPLTVGILGMLEMWQMDRGTGHLRRRRRRACRHSAPTIRGIAR